jgi:hypothetical protein
MRGGGKVTYILEESFASFSLTLLLGSVLFVAASVGPFAVYQIRGNQGLDAQASYGQGQLPSANHTDQLGH